MSNELQKSTKTLKVFKVFLILELWTCDIYHLCILCVCICLVAQSFLTLCNAMDSSPPDFSVHGIFPTKNTGVGCTFFLLRIFLTQGLNSCPLHWQADSLPLSHLGSLFLYTTICLICSEYSIQSLALGLLTPLCRQWN